MKILCFDTSSKLCSCAILENNNLIDKIELDNGLTHSQNLMPIIQKLLSKNDLNLKNIDLLVCDIGPGSFTGIRIGIATAKAFEDSFNIPAIGVDSLMTLAYNVKSSGIICSVIDCKNNNCYYGIYNLEGNIYTILKEPNSDSFDNCIKFIKQNYSDNNITFVGDLNDNFKNIVSDNIKKYAFSNSNLLDIYNLGLIGFNLYCSNPKSNYNILPLYLKKPQAQRQLESKNISIRPMIIEDCNLINIDQFDNFWNLQNLISEVKSKNSKFLVALINGEIVGFAGIKIVLDEADIMNIVVKKSFRRQGVAKALMNDIENLCVSFNISTINLEVNENNFAAINLYKISGFTEVGRRKKYYNNINDAILMKKILKK